MRYTEDVSSPEQHTAPPPASRRERARAATFSEIKQTAYALMREHGTTDVRFTDIARVMGLTPPALYRYYDDRDQLLTDMITDGYHDLAEALASSTRAMPEDSPPVPRLRAVGTAFRTWAREYPERFALIFGIPVPGYSAPEEGPTVAAAQRAMANLAAVVVDAAARGRLSPPLVREVAPVLVAAMEEQRPKEEPILGPRIDPATHQAMLHAWAGLHGFVCLEAYGHLDWFPEEARDALFEAQLRLAALAIGLVDS
jgi:AcrR family transcriptional regulator